MASSLHMDQLCDDGKHMPPIGGNNTIFQTKNGVRQEALFHTFRSKPPEKTNAMSFHTNRTRQTNTPHWWEDLLP